MELERRRISVQAGTSACSLSDDSPGWLLRTEMRGIPSEDGVGLTSVERPRQSVWQEERGVSRGSAISPAELSILPDHPGIDVGAEVERQPKAVSSCRLETVDDLEFPKSARQTYRSAVVHRWGERSVAVVLCGPRDDFPACCALQLDQSAPSLTCPKKGAALGRLVVAAHLHGVVSQGRSKIAAPAGFTVIAVGTWIGQDIHPVVSINEAVDIAKKFSTGDSGKFVNGLLDKIKGELLRPARIVK